MSSGFSQFFNQLAEQLDNFLEFLSHFPEDFGLEYIEAHEGEERQQLLHRWNIFLHNYDSLRRRWEEDLSQRDEEESAEKNIPEPIAVPVEDERAKTRRISWAKIRKERIRLDGYSCQTCGFTKRLHVHHLTYEREGHEELEDLVTLCNQCHAVIPKRNTRGGDG